MLHYNRNIDITIENKVKGMERDEPHEVNTWPLFVSPIGSAVRTFLRRHLRVKAVLEFMLESTM